MLIIISYFFPPECLGDFKLNKLLMIIQVFIFRSATGKKIWQKDNFEIIKNAQYFA